MYKRSILLFTLTTTLIFSTILQAQVPHTLSYQGMFTDTLGHPKPDGQYSFTFRIYSSNQNGTALWSETKTLNLKRGLFNTTLGNAVPINLEFDVPYWLGIQVSSYPELTPRIPLTSVGYSFHALKSDTAAYAISATKQSFTDSSRIAGTIPNNTITTDKILNGTITPEKLNSTGASSGQVLKFNGLNVTWADENVGGLIVPYNGSTSSDNSIFSITNTGSGNSGVFSINNSSNSNNALEGIIISGNGNGVVGESLHQFGVLGRSLSGTGVRGYSTNGWGISGNGSDIGVFGTASITGVRGDAGATGKTYGVYGTSNSTSGIGVFGQNTSSSGFGVSGISNNVGTYGEGNNFGVIGYSSDGSGIYGEGSRGVWGRSTTGFKSGVEGWGTNQGVYSHNLSGTDGHDVYLSTPSYAAVFWGDIYVNGNILKSGGTFKIDHPLDPANKYLNHSFVESPEMKNIYDGIITLDALGQATVTLPDWFEALNKDFRYQLTAIGSPAPNLYISKKIYSNKFSIAGGTAGMEVSWQITGIRHDPWANAHQIPVEEEKKPEERGFYKHPELYGQPVTKMMQYAAHPEIKQISFELQKIDTQLKTIYNTSR